MTRWMMVAALVAGMAQAKDDAAVPDVSLDQVKFGAVVNGMELKQDELKGKVVVVERWGTRCGPCVAFLPELAKIHRRYDSRGLQVVGMEVQQSDKEAIMELCDDARVKYPVVKGGQVPVKSAGIPHACVFGADGKLVWAGNPHDDAFLDAVKDALRELRK